MSKRRPASTPASKAKRTKTNQPESRDDTLATSLSSTNKVVVLVDKLAKQLTKHADVKKSQQMKKYMRDQFDFFGLTSPLRKKITQDFSQQPLSPEETRTFVRLLWQKPEREFQYFAVDYLEKHIKLFADPLSEFEVNMQLMEYLITNQSWWDTVDAIAYKVVGYLVKRYRDSGNAVMEKWIDHENMWLRRTALLHQLSYKEQTDEAMLFRFCSSRAHETKFFIRKAIGWALRQHARTASSNVRKYLLKNKANLSALSFKEASKHLTI